MPKKMSGGGYNDFYTPMNKGPKKGEPAGQPAVANVPVVVPPDPTGVVPGGKSGKSKKIGM